VAQHQLGAQWRHDFAGSSPWWPTQAALAAYAGSRRVTQFLAIPAATQSNPRHPGGVVDFGREYMGADLRLTWRWALDDGRQAELVAGLAMDEQDEARRGYENFTGSGAARVLGVQGQLRRDEANRAATRDGFAQLRADIARDWALTLGVRSGRLSVRSADAYLSNGDDSGALHYAYTVPVAALQWRASPRLNLYVSSGRGYETPTLTELAYLRDAEVKGVIDAAGQARATELLYQTRSLRGLAIDDPQGQRLSLPTLRKARPVDYPPPSYPGPAGLGGNWPAGPGSAPLGSQLYSRVDPKWGPPPG